MLAFLDKKLILWFLLTLGLLFTGCSTKTVYKTLEVKVPVKCNYTMPDKPVYSKEEFDSAKAITQYYLQIEEGLRQCLKD